MPYNGADPTIAARVTGITENLRMLFRDMTLTQEEYSALRRIVLSKIESPDWISQPDKEAGERVRQIHNSLAQVKHRLNRLRAEWSSARAATPADIGRYITLADLIPADQTAALFNHRITLTFVLEEDVSPDFFARRVAEACANEYAIKEREGVVLPSNPATILTFAESRTKQPGSLFGVGTLTHGDDRKCPEVQKGIWTRCHGHLTHGHLTPTTEPK